MPNEAEAKIVRHIFARYLELGSVMALRDELKAEGVRSKIRTSSTGRRAGGAQLHHGALFAILKNRTYIGETTHKDNVYPGAHAAILPRALFDRVQERLAAHRVRRAAPISADISACHLKS